MSESLKRAPQVVVVNRCFIKDEQERILITKRSSGNSHRANVWEIPGGKLEEGESLSVARKREVFEETGLKVTLVDEKCCLKESVCSKSEYKGFPYLAIFCVVKVSGGKFKLSDEHQIGEWVTYDELLGYHNLDITIKEAAIVLGDLLR